MKRLSIFFILLIFSCTQTKILSQVSIGIDLNLPQVQSVETKNDVIGFIKDFLLEGKNINFYFVNDDANHLIKGLSENKYDLIFSSFTPYNFNENNYDFSKIIIPLGPYPVIRKGRKVTNLSDFKNKIIGVQESDLGLINFKGSEWNLKIYDSELSALSDLANGVIDVALIRYLSALSYVEDTFYNQLQMLNIPLNNQGYRFISLKGKHIDIIRLFNNKLDIIKKDGALIKKWGLSLP